MRRKVIKQGNNTLTITLPRKWTEQFSIKAGDELEVMDHSKLLTITTGKPVSIERTEFEANGPDKFLELQLGGAYKKGFDEVAVRFSDKRILNAIQQQIEKEFMGYEIVEQGKNTCLIKDIAGSLSKEFDSILRRIFLMLISMSKESLEILKDKEFVRLSEIELAEKTNDKLTNFCKRILNKRRYGDYKNINFVYCVVWELEKIANGYEGICKLFKNKTGAVLRKEVLNFYEDTNNLFEQFYHLFYKYDLTEAIKFLEKKKKMISAGFMLLKKTNYDETLLMLHLISLVVMISGMAGPCLEINCK